MNETILIAGAGPGGLVAAIALARRGFDVRVFERHPALRTAGAGLTLQVNAIRMLASLDLADAVVAAAVRLAGGGIEGPDGSPIQLMEFAPMEARHGRPGVAIHRGALADVLAAAVPAGAMRFGAAVADVREEDGGVVVTLTDGREERGAALVGADGIHSAVRRALFGEITPRYAGYTAWRGIARRATGIGPGRVAERWGVGRRFGIVPVGPDRTYWFATRNAPAGGVDGDVIAELHALFADFGDPVPALLDATPAAEVLRNDIVDLPVLPRWTRGRVTLLGDAAHAMTPNMGQGACQAIEDAVVLADRLARLGVPAGLEAYEAARKARAVDIVRRSDQIGRVAQWENPLARGLRDAIFRLTPASAMRRQLDALYGVEVPTA